MSRDVIAEQSSSRSDRALLNAFILASCIKLLLIPTYHSTDFEVHRNWLAITRNLPIKEWYVSAKSPWTLDYPPLFAWFESILGCFADFFDVEMSKVDNLNYISPATKLFQRITVVLTDSTLAYGVREVGKVLCKRENSFEIFIFLSLFNAGLLVVDHVHFQYNGFLLGVLLLSLARVAQSFSQRRVLAGAFWFAVLLNLKHIYIYVAPAYVVWLLGWCRAKDGEFFKRFLKLGGVVAIVFVASFGPFVAQLPQVMSRLFPFKRGLVHAYWAANAWALYTGADKVLSVIWKRLGWSQGTSAASMTGGLVGEGVFAVLPAPPPAATFAITFASMIPALWTLFARNKGSVDSKHLVRCVVLCGLGSFLFGWHVHEKAILTSIIPLCALAGVDKNDGRVFVILSSAGHAGLLPLLYLDELTPLKVLLSTTYTILASLVLCRHHRQRLLNKCEWFYVGGLPFVTIYESVLHKVLFPETLPFLPLALTSLYCAVGIVYSWLLYYYIFLSDDRNDEAGGSASDKADRSASKHKKKKIQ